MKYFPSKRSLKISLICLGAIGAAWFAIRTARLQTERLIGKSMHTKAPKTEARIPGSPDQAHLEPRRMAAKESSDARRRDAVLVFLKRVGVRRGYKEITAVMDLVQWARGADAEDVVDAVVYGRSVMADAQLARMLDLVVFARLGEIDPEAGQSLMFSLPGNRRPEADAVEAFFRTWVHRDPIAATDAAIAQFHQDPKGMGEVLKEIFEPLSFDNPSLAFDFASELARSDEAAIREIGYASHAKLMSREFQLTKNFQSAVSWIGNSTVSDGERDYLLTALVREGLEGDDPAGTFYAYGLLGADARTELSSKMVRALIGTQADEAKMLALSLPSGDARETTIKTLSDALSEKVGVSAVLDWLAGQEPSPDFDATYASFATNSLADNPEIAYRSITLMTGSERKDELISSYGFNWLQKDYANASHKLPVELVSQYNQVIALAAQIRQVSRDYHGTLQF